MTDVIDPIGGAERAERLDALAIRPSRTDSSRRDGPSFERLLAQAAVRENRRLAAVPDNQAVGLGSKLIAPPRPRPTGALGAAMPAAGSSAAGSAQPGALLGATSSAFGLSSSAAGSPAGEAAVAAAADYLGVPYLWGGTDAVKGFDCSGLIQQAYRDIGVEMPKWSRHQATMGVEVPSIEQALPGDVIAFGDPVNHVALYTGDGQMLHAPKTGDVVRIGPIDRPIASIRRIVAPGGTPIPGAVATGGTAPVMAANGTLVASSAAPNEPGRAELQYRPLFESAGERWNVDPALLAAIAKTESNFNPEAVSPVGARGLMQFMPATADEMNVNPSDPASAIDGAARYLRTSLDQFESHELAIASYNAGRGAVSRYGGIPPFNETQNYVQKVMDAWRSRS